MSLTHSKFLSHGRLRINIGYKTSAVSTGGVRQTANWLEPYFQSFRRSTCGRGQRNLIGLYMSFQFYSPGHKPQKLADEVLEHARFGYHAIDEFTLYRYKERLERVREERDLDEDEYAALILVQFLVGRRDDCLSAANEGLSKYPLSLRILANRALALMQISESQGWQLDLDKEWFDHPANPNSYPLEERWGFTSIATRIGDVSLQKEVRGFAKISRDVESLVSFGPFEFTFEHAELREVNWSIPDLVMPLMLEAYFLGRVTTDESAYLDDVLGDEGKRHLEQLRDHRHVRGTSGKEYTVDVIELPGEYLAFLSDGNAVGSGDTDEEAVADLIALLGGLREAEEGADRELPNDVRFQYQAAEDLAEA